MSGLNTADVPVVGPAVSDASNGHHKGSSAAFAARGYHQTRYCIVGCED